MKETVLAFIERINQHDVEGIMSLLADDYVFVNSSGDRFQGRQFMRETWRSQFEQHPDFEIDVERIVADSEAVGVFGWSKGTYRPLSRPGEADEEDHWEVPAAFLGIARGGKMVHWQVFSDASIVFDVIKQKAEGEE